MSVASSSSLWVGASMLFNFASSVGIITLNKLVFKAYKFNFPTFLTGIHFVFTFIGLVMCNAAGMFTVKRVPAREILPLALSFTGFVTFNNLSLQYNSVGFYQLMKVLTTPVIVVIQLIGFGVPLHNKLKLALVPICVGVSLATVTDIELNFWGVMWAIAGIISTSFYQIWVKTKQQDLGLDSYQLLFLQAPPSALLVFALSAVSEPISGPGGLLDYAYTYPSLSAILGTAVLSFCVNLSIFLVIGKTSPVAYNVLGYFKLVCILAAGFLFFHEEANAVKVAGTVITFVGVCVYTQLQQSLKSGWEGREKQAAQQNGTAPSPQQKAAGATNDEAMYSLLSMPPAVASAEAEAEGEGETGRLSDTAIAVEARDHADADADADTRS